jgi:DNA replication and repair protein RecF
VDLRYRPSPASGLEGAATIAVSLESVAERERRRQMPLLGPHRDELEILWGGHDIRRVASAGERKSLSLLLLAAHGRTLEGLDRRPVYLLDDVDAELATVNHASVWKVFQGDGTRQILASSNRPQVWLTLEVGKIWEMEKGKLSLLS